MEAVYVTHYPIPELGAQPGDHLVVKPAHPRTPLQVVRNFDRHALVRLLGAGHLDRLTLVAGELVRESEDRSRPLPPERHPSQPLRLIQGGAR